MTPDRDRKHQRTWTLTPAGRAQVEAWAKSPVVLVPVLRLPWRPDRRRDAA